MSWLETPRNCMPSKRLQTNGMLTEQRSATSFAISASLRRRTWSMTSSTAAVFPDGFVTGSTSYPPDISRAITPRLVGSLAATHRRAYATKRRLCLLRASWGQRSSSYLSVRDLSLGHGVHALLTGKPEVANT